MDIKTPAFPESITEGTVAEWHKVPGEFVRRDDVLVDIETDKVVMEVLALDDGTITEIIKQAGEAVESEELLGQFETGSVAAKETAASTASTASSAPEEVDGASPAARKLASESGVAIDSITGSGRDGRVTKEDVAKAVSQGSAQRIGDNEPVSAAAKEEHWQSDTIAPDVSGERIERRVPMTRLRASIARRLVEAQHNAAMLTTFNEADMAPIMALRKQYQEDFQRAHNGTRLGFMSFFVRAATEALKRFPSVNASIDDEDVVYHGYYDIGVAVSTDRGLVVPVVREADALGMAQIEDQINAYGEKARAGKLALEDMAGGTFTISNGGIFGSLMSTPILNAPQTGVLGMHKIQERAVVVDGEIVIRPMMNLALSYDHRLIDGREAVQFLVAIKGMIEDPARILLEL